ncbi:unnamed protein product [Rotaria magnacalcarata]|uniref:Uncharacterized protein n=1 Tax=Rotaria magnacalcarata TaxID=392030 RepID=A0A815K5T6_9BILA
MTKRELRTNQPPPNTFNDRRDTNNESRKAASQNAKDANGITRSQSPTAVTHIPEVRNGFAAGRYMRQNEYNNQYGQLISIREDPAVRYPDGGTPTISF